MALSEAWKKLRRQPPPARRVIVHAHMFKNAGTTLDSSLARSFGEAFVDHRDDEEMKRGADYLGPWLRDNPGCRAISSHWITPPLPSLDSVRLYPLLMFRDPIERAMSVYRFERQQQGVDTPGSQRAKRMSFLEYMEWQLQPMPGPVVKNYQVRYCSGDYLGEDLPAMYERAVALLQSTRTLGLVHRYDESMVLFEYQLRHRFPDLDLSFIPQNVLGDPALSMEEKRLAVLSELGPIRQQVLDANQYDMRLFALAVERFEMLLSAVPDLGKRLADLRRRNARLAGQS